MWFRLAVRQRNGEKTIAVSRLEMLSVHLGQLKTSYVYLLKSFSFSART